MRLILLSILFLYISTVSAQTNETILLWESGKLDKNDVEYRTPQTDDVVRITKVKKPALIVYKSKKPNGFGAGIIVSPGGGYGILAIDKEGHEIAQWLNELGYTAFVLQYTVPQQRDEAFKDIQRAIRTVRSNAKNYALNPEKIGVLGFSAGGHLSASAATNFKTDSYSKVDVIDKVSPRPNFTMLIYPAYLDKGADRTVSPELTVTNRTPPFFIFGTADDVYGNSTLAFSTKLRDKNIPVELHVLAEGGHGYGLRKGNVAAETWPVLAEAWLKNTVQTDYLANYEQQVEINAQEIISLNDIQVIGSHNSYKIEIEKPLWNYLFQVDANMAKSLQYEHPSLTTQLDIGLRNLELDILHDPLGGRYAKPKGLDIVKQTGNTPLPFDENGELEQPGLKMFHVQDVDFRSHQLLFKNGLKELLAWSEKNPNHTPIFILVNAKDSEVPQTTKPLPFTATALDSLDMEIKSVLPTDKLITPDLVRGDFKTLEEAITTKGWPNLDSVKGRFIFVLDEKEEKINRYVKDHPSLKNRVLFVNSPEGNPEAAFRIINDPVKDFDHIKELVAKGYLVRTRADAGTKEARTNDYSRFEKAKASGAQIISTDYYIPSTLFPSDFKVIFEDGSYERKQK